MKSGKCPKCDSSDIYALGERNDESLRISAMSAAWITNLVCANCGYVEKYIMDSAKRAQITQKWKKWNSETDTP